MLRQYAHLLPGQLPLVQTPDESPLGDSAAAPKPRRRADASARELPGLESLAAEPDDTDDDDTTRAAAEVRDSKTGLDKVAAGAKK